MKTKAKRNETLRVLCLEDDPRDAEIMRELLTNAGFVLEIDCTDKEKEFVSFLRSNTYDIILSDFKLPGFDGFKALRLSMEICPNVPFICVSGTIGEEAAVELLKQGAVDYVLKHNLKRLPFAIKRALDEAKEKAARHRADESLIQSQHLLAETEKIGNIGGWEFNIDTGKQHWTEEVYHIHEVELSYEPTLENGINFYTPASRQIIDHAVQRAIKFGEPFDVELEIITAKGNVRQVHAIGNRDLEHRRVYGFFQDITERKRAEEELKFKNIILSTQQEVSIDGILVIDENGKILSYNNQFVRMWGILPEVIETQSDELVMKSVMDTLEEPQQFIEKVNYLYAHRNETSRDEVALKDCRTLDRYSAPMFGSDAKYYGRVWYFRDITERKRAEEILRESESKARAMFQAIPDMIFRLDHQGIFLDYKADVKDLYAQSVQTIIGKRNRDITPPEFADLIDLMIETTIVSKTLQTFEYHLPAPGGGVKNFEARMVTSGVDEVTVIVRDITERKRAEEALRESERKYHNLYLNASLGIFHSTIEGKFIDMNPALAWMLGYNSPEEAVDCITNISEQIYAEPQRRDDIAASTLKAGGILTVENLYQRRDGSLWSGMLHICIATDQHGNPSIFEGFIEDITERKRAEEALLQSEERFRSIYENSTIGLYRTTPDGKIILANPTLVKMLGYSTFEELAIRNLEQEGFEPSYERKQFIELINLYGEVKGLESAWNRKDGSIIYIRESARAIHDPDGKTLYYDGSVEDVTERKQAEEALVYERNLLRSLMENVPDHIYFKDLNSRFLRLSKSQADRFGISDPAQAIGKTDFDFFTEDHAKPAYEHEQEIIKTGLPLVNIEEKETWPDGKETWVSTTKVPLRDLSGKIIGTFGISRDMTEQKKLQSQLQQTQKVQSIGTLAGGIAHDFNNILGIILAFTSMLDRSEGNKEKILKSTTAITQAVSRGAALVRQILTFARQTGVVIKPMDISGLVREIVNMLKETFPMVIEFRMIMEKNIPYINADQTQLHQVLLNLCVNARDAMPKGGVITIEVKMVMSETLSQQFPEARNDRYIFISVSDTGTGMDEATKSCIFDPFFTTKEQGKGTGLGLSVVHGVVQDHHGFISVESTVGQGTTFLLYLPVPQEEKINQETKNIKADEEQRGTETILFVEDEQLLREVVQSTLESNGYKVLLATNGWEAVEIYKQQHKDIALVLSDMGLPKLGGLDVYAILKEINPNIKIIFASGFISQESKSELYKEGVKGFIMKPYGVHEVLHLVREVLNENGEK
jgi:PAS domain S-box-containing protein